MENELKFTQEIKDLWLKALRSGDYTQARGTYGDERTEFCCLAVLGDICKPFTKGENTYPDFSKVGINHGNLIDKNDKEEWNFNQIADYIEEHATVEKG